MTEADSRALKDESIPQLLRALSAETTTLVRQEIELAKVELAEKVHALTGSAGAFGVAALLAIGAFGAFTAALIAALALVLPVWGAALLLAAVYAVIAAIAALRGRRGLQRATPLIPQQTAQTVKDDIEWAKTRTRSSTK